jgi:hypothetical protein
MELGSAAEFVRLRSSDDPHDYGAADKGSARPEVWREVLTSYPDFRHWVARNKTVPLEILQILADDSDDRVRAAVATKHHLSPVLFDRLAQDPDETVRLRVAHNASTPRAVLERLARDRSYLVAGRARVRLAGAVARERA